MLAIVELPSLLANELISLHSEFISSHPVRKKGSSKNASLRLTGTVVSGIFFNCFLDIFLAAAVTALSTLAWMLVALVIMREEEAQQGRFWARVTVWASVAD